LSQLEGLTHSSTLVIITSSLSYHRADPRERVLPHLMTKFKWSEKV